MSNEFTVDYDEMIDQLADCANLKGEVASATGELRSKIKDILESSGYHSKALAMIRAIDEIKTPTKRADVLRTFKPMFDAMFEQKWRPEMMDLVDHMEDTAEELEDA